MSIIFFVMLYGEARQVCHSHFKFKEISQVVIEEKAKPFSAL